jgi:hypothetical protein
MLLVIVLQRGGSYGDRQEIKTPGIARTAEQGELLVAFNGHGDKVAQFNLADVRNYHLEED